MFKRFFGVGSKKVFSLFDHQGNAHLSPGRQWAFFTWIGRIEGEGEGHHFSLHKRIQKALGRDCLEIDATACRSKLMIKIPDLLGFLISGAPEAVEDRTEVDLLIDQSFDGIKG